MTRVKTLLAIAILLFGGAAWYSLKLWEDSYEEKPYALIEDGLYLGQAVRKPPPRTDAVVNVCGIEDPYTVEARLWAPVMEGGREPTLEWLREVADFIDEQRKAGRTVYVHCLAGTNRSPAAVAGYLMREHGWNRGRAVAHVREMRPQAYPNSELIRLLDDWQQELTIAEDAGRVAN